MQEVKPRSFVKWKTFVFQNKNSNGNPDPAPTEPPDRSGLHCYNAVDHPGNVRPAHLLVVSEGSFQWRLRTRAAARDLSHFAAGTRARLSQEAFLFEPSGSSGHSAERV